MKYLQAYIALGIVLVGFLTGAVIVTAQETEPNIQFPVEELGGCANKEECKTYCDNPDNMEVCIAFAEKHGLMKKDDVERAKKFAKIKTGPGGCTGRESCEAYCSNGDHADECIAFAEKHGMMPKEELEQAKKMMKLMKEEGGPGGCRTKNECEAYCHIPENMDVCIAFAEKAGFLKGEELQHAKKFRSLMTNGQTPGGCNSRESCESYCRNEANRDECFAFAEKNGLMKPEEIERFKKTGGKGPGGCNSKESCDAFCNNPDNQETCMAFAREHGFMGEQDLATMKDSAEKFKKMRGDMPDSVASCVKGKVGEEIFEKMTNGHFMPGPELHRAIKECFEVGGQRSGPPAEIEGCIRETLGDEAVEKMHRGELDMRDVEDKLRPCFERSHDGDDDGDASLRGGEAICLPRVLGEERAKRLLSGEQVEMSADEQDQIEDCTSEARSQAEDVVEDRKRRGQEGFREFQNSNMGPEMRQCAEELGDAGGGQDPAAREKMKACIERAVQNRMESRRGEFEHEGRSPEEFEKMRAEWEGSAAAQREGMTREEMERRYFESQQGTSGTYTRPEGGYPEPGTYRQEGQHGSYGGTNPPPSDSSYTPPPPPPSEPTTAPTSFYRNRSSEAANIYKALRR